MVQKTSSRLLKTTLSRLNQAVSNLKKLSSPITTNISYTDFIEKVQISLEESNKASISLALSSKSFFNFKEILNFESSKNNLKNFGKLVIEYLQNAKTKLVWVNEKFSPELKKIALNSGQFQRFIQSTALMIQLLDSAISNQLTWFLVFLQGSTEGFDSLEIFKGGYIFFRYKVSDFSLENYNNKNNNFKFFLSFI